MTDASEHGGVTTDLAADTSSTTPHGASDTTDTITHPGGTSEGMGSASDASVNGDRAGTAPESEDAAVNETARTEDDLDLDLPRAGISSAARDADDHTATTAEPVDDDADLDLPGTPGNRDDSEDTTSGPLAAQDLDVSATSDAGRTLPASENSEGPSASQTGERQDDGATTGNDTPQRHAITWSEQEPDAHDMTAIASSNGSATSTGTDDVVLDSTVVGTPSWATTDAWPSETNEPRTPREPTEAAGAKSDSSSRVAWSEEPSDTSPPATSTGTNTSASGADHAGSGPDIDWEPWGGQTGAGTSGSADAANPNDTGQADSALVRAGDLLDQLQTALTEIRDHERANASGQAVNTASGMIAEELVAARTRAIPADTLDTLIQRAEAVAGSEWDIRVLQQFAEQRQTILDLIDQYRQQQALLDRIRDSGSKT